MTAPTAMVRGNKIATNIIGMMVKTSLKITANITGHPHLPITIILITDRIMNAIALDATVPGVVIMVLVVVAIVLVVIVLVVVALVAVVVVPEAVVVAEGTVVAAPHLCLFKKLFFKYTNLVLLFPM